MLFNQSNELKQILKEFSFSQKNWWTLKDVCQYSKLSSSTIHRAIQKGELKVSKVTGKLLFKQAWIDRFLES